MSLRFGGRRFYAIMILSLFFGYVVVLALTIESTLSQLLTSAAANIFSFSAVAVVTRHLLKRYVLSASALRQVVGHIALGFIFTATWFWLLMIFLGTVRGESLTEFSVNSFRHAAATWQLFQGLIMYALVATTVFAELLIDRRDVVEQPVVSSLQESSNGPIFVKGDDEFVPLDPDRIVLVRGADDYSEIITEASCHLVRMRLRDIAERLGSGFFRVHRSYVVNISHIAKAEPAGNGALLLSMRNGAKVQTSRTGARLLRQRLI